MAILQSRPALKLGKLSYSLYLWHYPIYRMMAAAGASRFEVAFFGTAATFALAVASWHLVEKPMLRLKDRFATNANTPEAAHGVASPSIA